MGSIVTVGDEQLNALERSLHTTEQQRVSLHAHSAGAPLQESFTLYRKNCYVRPRKNEDSDVSWFVLRGQCDVVLFDHQGNVCCVERLGTVDSGMQYYFRIPRET